MLKEIAHAYFQNIVIPLCAARLSHSHCDDSFYHCAYYTAIAYNTGSPYLNPSAARWMQSGFIFITALSAALYYHATLFIHIHAAMPPSTRREHDLSRLWNKSKYFTRMLRAIPTRHFFLRVVHTFSLSVAPDAVFTLVSFSGRTTVRFLHGRTSNSPQTQLPSMIWYAMWAELYGRTFSIGVNVVKRFFNYGPLSVIARCSSRIFPKPTYDI